MYWWVKKFWQDQSTPDKVSQIQVPHDRTVLACLRHSYRGRWTHPPRRMASANDPRPRVPNARCSGGWDSNQTDIFQMNTHSTNDSALRVALVTGSTSGIGAAIARRLSHAGYAVVLHSRNSAQTGRAMAGAMKQAIYVQADLALEADRVRLVSEAISAWGQLDVLVNNAGMSKVIAHGDLASATSAVWHELHEVNVVAPFHLVALAETALRDAARRSRAGSVVNISSHAGIRPKGASIPYAVSKAALNHMTRVLALSLGPDIRVNAVAPGLVDTPLTADWTGAQELWRERAPMRRAATPDDIAHAVAMLVGSNYLTGEVLLSDGGLNLT